MKEQSNFYIQWHITDKCNLRCSHCYQDNYTSVSELKWLDMKNACDNVLDSMKRWNKKLVVTITGGEPFLYNDVWQMADYLDSSPQVSEVNFISNGTFVTEYMEMLRKTNKLNKLFVSLDGVTKETNDSIRKKGVYEKVTKNIGILTANKFNVIIMYTLMKSNYNDSFLLYDFMKSLGVKGFILERFIPLGTSSKIKNEVVSGADINRLYKSLFEQCNAEFNEKEVAKYRALQVEFITKHQNVAAEHQLCVEAKLYGAPCTAGRDGACILPDGSVLPCRRFYHKIGNVLDSPFHKIYESSGILKDICRKELLKGKCLECDIKDCLGCRAIALSASGDYMSEDPQCFLEM